MTVVTCVDTVMYTLCIQQLLLPAEVLHSSDICHLLISGVAVKIATDISCGSDGCHCKFAVSR